MCSTQSLSTVVFFAYLGIFSETFFAEPSPEPPKMRSPALFLCLLMLSAPLSGCLGGLGSQKTIFEADPEPLRINHIQVLGTHNSYHLKPFGPTIRAYDYSHEPLDVQAGEYHVRQFELDVWWDPRGDLRVYHNQYDSRSNCDTLEDCLSALLTWSNANENHVPFFIWVEPKEWVEQQTDSTLVTDLQGILEKIEDEISTHWPRNRTITPDDVRGEAENLSAAITTTGWPLLDDSRGKAIFVLLASGGVREQYHQAFPGLSGSLMFTMSEPGTPEMAILSETNPIGKGEEIRNWVEEGYIVRSRADNAEDGEADDNNTARRDAACNAGAHSISTDYPARVEGMEYWVVIPDGPVACNPVSAPAGCTAERIENLG